MSDERGHHHGVDYIELSVVDLARAKAFYGAVFGWRFHDYGPGYAGFVDGARGAREAGGLCVVDVVRPGGPLVIVYSHDLAATQAAVEEAGGKVVGRFELEDPDGNRLGVWGQ